MARIAAASARGFDSPQLHQPAAQAIRGIAEQRARKQAIWGIAEQVAREPE